MQEALDNIDIGDVTIADIEGLQTALDGKQPRDSDLTAIAALDSSQSRVNASDGGGWIRKTYADLKTAMSFVKADVGLANVDNTYDVNKPVSTATQTALDAKDRLALSQQRRRSFLRYLPQMQVADFSDALRRQNV